MRVRGRWRWFELGGASEEDLLDTVGQGIESELRDAVNAFGRLLDPPTSS
jgi:hypothetical protein